jgi:outer membrane receptor protein involved in Fe transport
MQYTSTFRLKLIAALAISVFSAPYLAFAENKAEALETGKVEVVSTTPLPGIGTPVNEVPANVQSTTGKEIETQHSLDIADYFNANLGGVTISEGQSNPYMSDVSFRGFTASPLAGAPQGLSVYLDGVRINEPFGDTVNWGLIPLSAISSINLIPGSNPIFGLNTLGGALSVNTKSGSQYPGFSAEAVTGSWGRKGFNASYGGEKGNVDYFFTGNFSSEDGWRNHSPSDVNQFFGKVGWQDETTDIDLSLTGAHNNLQGVQALPVSWLDTPKQAYTFPDKIENRLVMANLEASHFIGDDHLLAANIYVRRSRIGNFASNTSDCLNSLDTGAGEECDQTLPDPVDITAEGSNEKSQTDQMGYGLTFQYTYLGNIFKHNNQLTGGLSMDLARTNYGTSDQPTDFTADRGAVAIGDFEEETNIHAKDSYYGLYATDIFSFNDKLHLTLSGRYNYIKIKLHDNMDADDNTNKFVTGDTPNITHTFHRFNPAVGLNYNPNEVLGFYGSYNEGMRAPTPTELSCADPLTPCRLPTDFLADPALKPVVSKTWEAGVRGKAAKDWHWNATVFRTTLYDDIQFISSGQSFNLGYFQNVGETRRQGLELGLSGKIEKFHLAANYQYLQATFQSPVTFHNEANSSANANGDYTAESGDYLPNLPQNSLKLRVAYDFTPDLSAGVNMISNSSVYARGDENNQDDNGKVAGYTVFNLDANWHFHSNWSSFLKVINVFDRDYSTLGILGTNAFTAAGRSLDTNPANWASEQFQTPAAPRAAWIGVRYDFGGKSGTNVDID